jgi:hypothetical protein
MGVKSIKFTVTPILQERQVYQAFSRRWESWGLPETAYYTAYHSERHQHTCLTNGKKKKKKNKTTKQTKNQ